MKAVALPLAPQLFERTEPIGCRLQANPAKSECGSPPTVQLNIRLAVIEMMQFHTNHVSVSTFAGDYYQAMFEVEQEADDPGSPYLLIRRQFEDPEDDLC